MCGIVCTFGNPIDVPVGLLEHRGPDDYKRDSLGKCQIDYYRLAINDLTQDGMQPFKSEQHIFACNGEIREIIFEYTKNPSISFISNMPFIVSLSTLPP